MSDFDIKDWRRDLEDAMRANDQTHIGIMLDRLEREWEAIDGEADYWLDAAHASAPAAAVQADAAPAEAVNV